jgi:hypothetical protein
MTENEENELLVTGFMFGARLVRQAHGLESEPPKHLPLLDQIAHRDVTSMLTARSSGRCTRSSRRCLQTTPTTV